MVIDLKNWLKDWLLRPERTHVCKCCGDCCASFGGHLQASRMDLERWRRLGREDLLQRVNHIGWIWIDPATGKPEAKCPFLQRTGPATACCAIHEIKPDICRAYPTLAHGRRCLHGVFLGLVLTLAGYTNEVPEVRFLTHGHDAGASAVVHSGNQPAPHAPGNRRGSRHGTPHRLAARRKSSTPAIH